MLICIAEDVDVTLREVAIKVGITERAAQRIVADLAEAGIIDRRRVGRRNHYLVNRGAAIATSPRPTTRSGRFSICSSHKPKPTTEAVASVADVRRRDTASCVLQLLWSLEGVGLSPLGRTAAPLVMVGQASSTAFAATVRSTSRRLPMRGATGCAGRTGCAGGAASS